MIQRLSQVLENKGDASFGQVVATGMIACRISNYSQERIFPTALGGWGTSGTWNITSITI